MPCRSFDSQELSQGVFSQSHWHHIDRAVDREASGWAGGRYAIRGRVVNGDRGQVHSSPLVVFCPTPNSHEPHTPRPGKQWWPAEQPVWTA